MRALRKQGRPFLALASCAAATISVAYAAPPADEHAGDNSARGIFFEAQIDIRSQSSSAWHIASRDMAERYYQAYRLIGSSVLNLDGERIGKVENLVLDEQGDVTKMLVMLSDASHADGNAIAISPHRAEVVSTDGSNVTVIRVDLSREELAQAQTTPLNSNARVPAQRGAGLPDLRRSYGPLY